MIVEQFGFAIIPLCFFTSNGLEFRYETVTEQIFAFYILTANFLLWAAPGLFGILYFFEVFFLEL